jgi:hypothetical protein
MKKYFLLLKCEYLSDQEAIQIFETKIILNDFVSFKKFK